MRALAKFAIVMLGPRNVAIRIRKSNYDKHNRKYIEQNLSKCEDGPAELYNLYSHQSFLVFSIDSDVCFYPEEQKNLSEELKLAGVESRLVEVKSQKGHDAFLLEPELFRESIKSFLGGE